MCPKKLDTLLLLLFTANSPSSRAEAGASPQEMLSVLCADADNLPKTGTPMSIGMSHDGLHTKWLLPSMNMITCATCPNGRNGHLQLDEHLRASWFDCIIMAHRSGREQKTMICYGSCAPHGCYSISSLLTALRYSVHSRL